MKYLITLLVLAFSTNAFANYDSNFSGKVTEVLTYAYSKDILIRLEGQPNSHPICTQFDYLVIDSDVDPENRQMMLSRLLMAYASGESINIGYDGRDECVGARIKVYRVG